ncbi:MAG: excinuclease ABC subunit UvrA [Myxococcales bacterium]|nr:MAG: excinuclease ABC subunit UvrA [Myxococcales bacterium]
MSQDFISIRGAREHNLKDVNLDLPRDALIVITGLSGSGKSSLAFDTIYAEGQRRYVESLSAYARQFLEQMNKPDVDTIEGLSPAISIEQKTGAKNPRSTVATVTEIYDHFRLLYARVGRPHCYQCGKPIEKLTVQQMADQILRMSEGTRILLLAPVVRGRKGEYKKEFERWRKEGHLRVRIDGKLFDLSEEEPDLDRKKKHDIDVLIDRLVVKDGIQNRLAEGLELALKLAEGHAAVETDKGERTPFSERFGCVKCGIGYPEISPRLFSFNNPYGACPDCHGLGMKMYFDPELVVPDDSLSLADGAVAPWNSKSGYIYNFWLESVVKTFGGSMRVPFRDLPKKVQEAIFHGTGAKSIHFKYEDEENGGRLYSYSRPFEGVLNNLERRYRETQSDYIREDLERYMNYRLCPTCEGRRLRPEVLHIFVEGKNIIELTRLTVAQCLNFFNALTLTERERIIVERLLKEIRARLGFLHDVGLDYLSLDRSAGSLSGGENQRIRLATQIGSSLVGVLYILDEPSIGLHQRDNNRLLSTLFHLRDQGNTVIVVEHDEDTILAADHVVDMGPGAGQQGGEVVAQGTPAEIKASHASLTGRYLSGELAIPLPAARRKGNGKALVVRGARANNLKQIDVGFPLGTFICVTGVSGSGKSSLVIDTLLPSIELKFRRKKKFDRCDAIEGDAHIDKVIAIDQSPIGRTPRSNPATYTGLFAPIRDLFTALPEARARGYQPGRFSFNVKGGRCEACEGAGVIKIEMHFLPDIYVECEQCGGKRYNRETLEIHYKGKSISDVLNMTVSQAHDFFEHVPAIRGKLATLREVGLGYIGVGQPATTLSGGEAQRIKLARELSRRSTGRTLYILDEPTTGLHFDDINKLLEVLSQLVDGGNTVIVIEHNLDVIKTADWIIDLGPEGGDGGGRLVAEGAPEDVAANAKSYTGQYLKPKLARTVAAKRPKGKAAPARRGKR